MLDRVLDRRSALKAFAGTGIALVGGLIPFASVASASTPAKIDAAIRWFENHRGSTAYEGRCELAVELAFGTSGQYATALSNWQHRAQHHPYSSAPRGALVFYRTSAAGHVALSLGDGRVWSTSAGGRIGIVPISYFQNPLGWAYSPW